MMPIRRCARPAALLLLLPLAACRGPGAAGPGGDGARPARDAVRFPVEVAAVESRRVEYSVSAVGSVEAFEQVAVTARVGGVVERIRFQEGDAVAPDSVLAEIDPERYRLAAESARAALAKAEAGVAEARSGLERRESVNAKNPDLVRGEEVEARRVRWRSPSSTSTTPSCGRPPPAWCRAGRSRPAATSSPAR